MKKRNRFFATLVIIGVVYFILTEWLFRDRNKEFFIHFDSANICGELNDIERKYHGCAFKIKGVDSEYVFFPYVSENEKNYFTILQQREIR